MQIIPNFIVQFFTKGSSLYGDLQHLLGYTPTNVALYELALCHRSSNQEVTGNNERLEFLGDALLGAIIGEYLFNKYPTKGEGYLTDMRSKMVNRKTLNQIAIKIGLKTLMKFNDKDAVLRNSNIFGNALEALIGAIYIDKGYAKTRTFIRKKIILPFIDMEELEVLEANAKNKLISWATKQGRQIRFDVVNEYYDKGKKYFTVCIFLDEEELCSARAQNKKDAGKFAAELALTKINMD